MERAAEADGREEGSRERKGKTLLRERTAR